MKHVIIVALCAVSAARGQVITTYDSRFGIAAITSQYETVDVGVTDDARNPAYARYNAIYRLRGIKPPALIDLDDREGVTITGTLKQAKAELGLAKDGKLPEVKAYRELLGTNTYARLRDSYRDTINLATTGTVGNATLKNAFNAVLALDRLNHSRAKAREEREARNLKNQDDEP